MKAVRLKREPGGLVGCREESVPQGRLRSEWTGARVGRPDGGVTPPLERRANAIEALGRCRRGEEGGRSAAQWISALESDRCRVMVSRFDHRGGQRSFCPREFDA